MGTMRTSHTITATGPFTLADLAEIVAQAEAAGAKSSTTVSVTGQISHGQFDTSPAQIKVNIL